MASEFPKDTIGPPPVGNGMVARIQRLLTSPKTEWPVIDAEPMTMQGIMTGWVIPLAAIGPIAGLIRNLLFPLTLSGVTVRPSVIGSVVEAVFALGFAVLGVWAWSLVLDALAPNFKGTKNPIAALKLVAFSMTAAWLAQALQITWWTWPLAIVGLYSIYLFWVGVPATVKVPDDQRPVYVLIAVVIGVVVSWVVTAIAVALAGMMFAMTPGSGALTTPSGTITVGDTTIDTGKLEAQAAAIKASTEKMQASLAANGGAGAKAVDPAALQNLLPATLSGWNRTSIESTGGGAMGMNISDATAQFAAGDQSFHLKVSDTGAMGALAGLVNVTSSKQTATGYEKTALQDGNMVTEKWDTGSKSGTYSILVGKRFLVEAEGSAPSIDALKGAVGSVDLAKLAALGG